MPKVMAQCHGTMGPKHRSSLPHVMLDIVEKHTIITINM